MTEHHTNCSYTISVPFHGDITRFVYPACFPLFYVTGDKCCLPVDFVDLPSSLQFENVAWIRCQSSSAVRILNGLRNTLNYAEGSVRNKISFAYRCDRSTTYCSLLWLLLRKVCTRFIKGSLVLLLIIHLWRGYQHA